VALAFCSDPVLALGRLPIATTGFHCETDAGSDDPVSIDMKMHLRQLESLSVTTVENGAQKVYRLVDPDPAKRSFPAYVVANQMNDVHQTKVLVIDPTMKDQDGKPITTTEVITFRIKIKYSPDESTGKVLYSGSLQTFFPTSTGPLNILGGVECQCTDAAGQKVDCVRVESEEAKHRQESGSSK
jgi:hypothetical protein